METEENNLKPKDTYEWNGKKVLIVEDNDPNFIFLNEILKRTNIEIKRAITGKEAVNICSETDIDLVLMDIRLPEMDGYEATRIIKSLKPDLPVIAQTAYAMADDRIKCYESGCSGYFAKPVNRKELLAMMDNFLNG